MILPPPPAQPFNLNSSGGTAAPNATDLVNFSDGLVQECFERRTFRDAAAQRNYNLYLGNHFQTVAVDESERYVWNRIKTVVVSHAAIQNATRPQVKFSPRESGEPGLSYFNTQAKLPQTPETQAILSQMNPASLAMGQNGEFPQPLSADDQSLLQQAIEEGEQLTERAAALNMQPPPVIPPEAIVTINDSSAADALQLAFDAMWEDADADYYVMENSLLNGIIGWQFVFYQFDDEDKKHLLWNPEFPQVFLDPTRTDIRDSQWAILDHVLSADEAIARFPAIEQVIRDKSSEGRVVPAGVYFYNTAAVYQETIFRRNMLTLRTVWVRHQKYPLTPQEALSKGLVKTVPMAATSADAGAGGTDAEAPGFLSRAVGSIKKFLSGGDEVTALSDKSDEQFGKGDVSAAVDAEPADTSDLASGAANGSGGAAGDPLPPGPVSRDAYFLTNDDTNSQEIAPGHEKWPTRDGIRRYQIIVGEVVSDSECETIDIPLAHNVNFPIPYTPWGQGTPEDLEGLNMAINNLLSDLVTHQNYNTFPQQTIPQSVHNQLPTAAQNKYIRPGTPIIVPDNIFTLFKGELFANQSPPQMSPDVWKLLTQVIDLINQQGEMAQVLNGQAAPGWSGDAIGKLQAAAQGSILFRSKRTEKMVKYLAKLMVGSILFRVPPEWLANRVRKYPIYVWYALHDWMKTCLAYDLSVEIASGGGVNKQQRTGQLLGAAAQGVPISPQTLIESLDKDPDVELRQSIEWQRKVAAAGGQAPPGQIPSSLPAGPPQPAAAPVPAGK